MYIQACPAHYWDGPGLRENPAATKHPRLGISWPLRPHRAAMGQMAIHAHRPHRTPRIAPHAPHATPPQPHLSPTSAPIDRRQVGDRERVVHGGGAWGRSASQCGRCCGGWASTVSMGLGSTAVTRSRVVHVVVGMRPRHVHQSCVHGQPTSRASVLLPWPAIARRGGVDIRWVHAWGLTPPRPNPTPPP